jgi:4-alpha-glucanotransferase
VTSMREMLKFVADSTGIEPEYTDTLGRTRPTDPDMAARILAVKGVRISPNRLRSEREVLVFRVDDLPDYFPVGLNRLVDVSDAAQTQGEVDLVEKTNRIPPQHWTFQPGAAEIEIDPKTGCSQALIPFPADMEVGEYAFQAETRVNGALIETEILCFICPERAFILDDIKPQGRIAGVQAALYGVRSDRNWGVGDFTDLLRIIDWAAEDLRVDFVGLNPLHALGNRRPYNNSPYNPSSRFYRNFIYLDVTAIPDYAHSAKAASLAESPVMKQKIARLRAEDQVNYEEVASLKLSVLREVFSAFMESRDKSRPGDQGWSAFQTYVKTEGVYLQRFATFCALEEHFKSAQPPAETWREWPEPYGDPESPEIMQFQKNNEESILFWMYLQWRLDEQLRAAQDYAIAKGMLVGLYHDEALSVDRNGADFWAWRRFFHEEFSVGAPPDPFAPDGQDWGFPPPDSAGIMQSGYQPFLKKLRASCKHCGALRIDHVMQLHHLFWIPGDGKPKDGVYVKDNESDLLNLLVLESRKSRTIIIGEDLGTVPFDLRDRLMARGVLSYRLFYFERDLGKNHTPSRDYPESALVSISTHDLPTLAGFWQEKDIEARRGIGHLDEERTLDFKEDRAGHKGKIIERLVVDGFLPADVAHKAWESPFPTEPLHEAVLRFVLSTPSKLVVINQEDIFLDLRQQNLPGTTWENPNWVTKMKFTVEELRSDPEAVRLSDKFRSIVDACGRAIGGV